jgi:hypothetical protein
VRLPARRADEDPSRECGERLAELLGLKARKPVRNCWIGAEDVRNMLELAGFEQVALSRRILMPMRVPFLTTFLNGRIAGARAGCRS